MTLLLLGLQRTQISVHYQAAHGWSLYAQKAHRLCPGGRVAGWQGLRKGRISRLAALQPRIKQIAQPIAQ